MGEEEQQRKEREQQEDLRRLHELRPIDDDFMGVCLKIISHWREHVPFVWMRMEQILKIKDMIVKSKDLAREPTHTAQDTIPACRVLRIWMLGRNLQNCRIERD